MSFSRNIFVLAWAAIIQYHSLGGKQQKFTFHSSEGWEPEDQGANMVRFQENLISLDNTSDDRKRATVLWIHKGIP
jgi:hypothetical protein